MARDCPNKTCHICKSTGHSAKECQFLYTGKPSKNWSSQNKSQDQSSSPREPRQESRQTRERVDVSRVDSQKGNDEKKRPLLQKRKPKEQKGVGCYNCGSQRHSGEVCLEPTIDELLKSKKYQRDEGPRNRLKRRRTQ
eukprot:TRINITY_DN7857_c0_g1_i1.p3 TRINITY_DN7857_c0_g1~~TRINITY_DN7857_c0_g1_i1.p3  ORF type:complete len:138 (-),score=18.06 TRINITY_DN7857_c0_g1_i1:209-622(-)